MARIDLEVLQPFATRYMRGSTLTPSERAEVLRIAQGLGCKDSAAAANVSPETIRARRKRIYRKLEAPGAAELIASMLAESLGMLARGERLEAVADQPAPEAAAPKDGAPTPP